MLGKFTNSLAPRLGKIGHTVRGDAAGTHTGELRNLIDQMGLIAVAEFCSHACRAERCWDVGAASFARPDIKPGQNLIPYLLSTCSTLSRS